MIKEIYPRLVPNGIYRHFKEKVEGEDALYLLSGLAKPIPRNLDKKDLKELEFTREDTRQPIKVYKLGADYFYDEEDMHGIYIIYTALYGNRLTYLRDINVFFSKRDKEKHPNYKQENRFELVAEIKPIKELE